MLLHDAACTDGAVCSNVHKEFRFALRRLCVDQIVSIVIRLSNCYKHGNGDTVRFSVAFVSSLGPMLPSANRCWQQLPDVASDAVSDSACI